jgi:tetrahydromethanopterin S-methyltransferase subunit F
MFPFTSSTQTHVVGVVTASVAGLYIALVFPLVMVIVR